MKNFLKLTGLIIIAAFVLPACGKKPSDDINKAKVSVNALDQAGAGKYAYSEFNKLNDNLNAALDEISAQEKKFFKNFKYAKELLSQVVVDADNLNVLLPAKIGAAKSNSEVLQVEAQIAVKNIEALLKKVNVNRNNKTNIDALKEELDSLMLSLLQIQSDMETFDYISASDQAQAIKEKALGLSEQIDAEIAKARK